MVKRISPLLGGVLCLSLLLAAPALAKKQWVKTKKKPPAFAALRIGLVLSRESQKNAREGKKAVGILATHNRDELNEMFFEVFRDNFRLVEHFDSIAEALESRVDLVAILEIIQRVEEKEKKKGLISAVGRGLNQQWEIVAGATLVSMDNEEIGSFRSVKEVNQTRFLAAAGIGSAFKKTIHNVENAMRDSKDMQAFARDYDPDAPRKRTQTARQVPGDDAEETEDRPISSEADTPTYKLKENPNSFALVVGVEEYRDLVNADFAVRDANAVRDHLAALGVPDRNIVLLTNDRASKAGLAKNLEVWLPNVVDDKSTVFFYYSGHGAPDIKSKEAYLVPADGDPKYLEVTGYPVARLYQKLNALKAPRIVVALDACFSGAGGRSVIPKGTRPLVLKLKETGISGKMAVLAASGSDEITGTAAQEGHGLFTYHLLKGLNGAGANARGRVTVNSLFDYLKPEVANAAKRENRDQTPTLRGLEDSDWTLRK